MDAATLRIILLVLGVALLGAMYLWERRRCAADQDDEEPERHWPSGSARREPIFHGQFDDEAEAPGMAFDADAEPSARRRAWGDSTPMSADESADELGRNDQNGRASRAARGADGMQREESSAAGPAKSASAQGSSAANTLVVQLFVFARDQVFEGEAVAAVAASQHLVPGEMDIYHRRNLDGSGQRTRFSMANLVKPGTFPFDEMASFSTPGVALFAELDGLPSDLMVYDELVQTARAIADKLDGELCLPGRQPFDDEAWEQLRVKLLALINDRADALAAGGSGDAGEDEGVSEASRRAPSGAGRSPTE